MSAMTGPNPPSSPGFSASPAAAAVLSPSVEEVDEDVGAELVEAAVFPVPSQGFGLLGEFVHDDGYQVGGEVESHQVGGPVEGRFGIHPPLQQSRFVALDGLSGVRRNTDSS